MIYFFYGPSDWQSQQEVKKIEKKNTDFEVEKNDFETSDLEPGQFSNKLTTGDFFSSKKIIKIFNLSKSKNKEQIGQNLENLKFDENNIYIFVEKKIDKKTKIFKTLKKIAQEEKEFPELKSWQADKVVKEMVEKSGLKMARTEQEKLVMMLGGDLWLAEKEIEKIKKFRLDERVTEEDIDLLVKGKINDDIFALVEMIAAKNKKGSLRLLRDQIEMGGNEIYLLTMIIRQFRILIQIKSASESGVGQDLPKVLGLHPFVVQKTMPSVSRYNMDELKEIYDKLVFLDRKLKSSKVAGEVWLEKFILEM